MGGNGVLVVLYREVLLPGNNVVGDMTMFVMDRNDILVVPDGDVSLLGSVLDGDMTLLIIDVMGPCSQLAGSSWTRLSFSPVTM